MKSSESLKEIAPALAKAQSEIKPAEFDAENPHFRSRYASLASIVAATRQALSHHGLSMIQTLRKPADDYLVVTTLIHSSGEWIEDEGVPLIIDKKNMQGLGSAFTYARRYGMSAMLCVVADEDDDGNTATAPPLSSLRPKEPLSIKKIDPDADQRIRLGTKMQEAGWTKEDMAQYIKANFKKAYKEMTFDEREEVIQGIKWPSESGAI